MNKSIYIFALLFTASIFFFGCGSDNDPPSIAVTGITLNHSTLLLTVGNTETLIATVTPSDATNPTVTWSSSNNAVATVSNGVVTAVTVGTATITARTACGRTATCAVTVSVPATGIMLNRTTMEMSVGTSETLVATVTPSNASQTVMWSSSNPEVATVNDNGVVTAIEVGTTTITATAAGGAHTATCEVRVNSVGVGSPTATTDPGMVINGIRWATRNVNAFGTFAANPHSTGMFYQWNRRQGWAATGNVTGWNNTMPEGTIWERVNDPCPEGWRVPTHYEFQTLLRVTRSWTTQSGVNGFTFGTSPYQIFLPAAGLRNTNGALSGTNAQGRYWSNTHLATSNDVNFLTFNSGSIQNTTGNRAQGFSVRCVENVTISVASIELNRTTMSLVIGASAELVGTITPANATDTRIVWTSSNNAIATVDNNGVVLAVSTGSATITATSGCGLHTATCAVTVTGNLSSSIGGVLIDGVRWATRNVDAPGNFAAAPESWGQLYQWNRRTPGWTSGWNGGATWESANNPCPAGWRIPVWEELQSLVDAGSIMVRYRNIPGFLFGYGANKIFLPSAGDNRSGFIANRTLHGFYWGIKQGATFSDYWTSEEMPWELAHIMVANKHRYLCPQRLGAVGISQTWTSTFWRASAYSIRCVAE